MSEVSVETEAEIGPTNGEESVSGVGPTAACSAHAALPADDCTVSDKSCNASEEAKSSTKITVDPPSTASDLNASVDHLEDDMVVEDSKENIALATGDASRGKPLVAPLLRVEQIKGDFSEDDTGSEGPLSNLSQAEISDQDLSGKESRTSDDFSIPDDDTASKVIAQVEFYFSDVNILKDAFLLKHVRRNKQGYVSIKLITSFKKVKSLSRDYRVVAHCLGKSSKLEVNEEGTKVRRLEPLPEFDETTPSRTIVAISLPLENPTIENIAELFKDCGEIALIRILRPGKTIPGDIKKYSNKHPEIGTSVCSVVEFENHESAQKACEMSQADDWRSGMRVVILSSKKKEKGAKVEKKEKQRDQGKKGSVYAEDQSRAEGDDNRTVRVTVKNDKGDVSPENQSSPAPERKAEGGGKRSKNKNKNKNRHSIGNDGGVSSGSEMDQANTLSDRDMNWRSSLSPGRCMDKSKLSPASTPGSSPRNSPRSSPRQKRRSIPNKSSPLAEGLSPRQSPKPSPMSSPESLRRNRESPSERESPSGSPWVQRRLKAAQEMSPLAADGSPVGSPSLGRRNFSTEGIVRQPKGPDGSKGFYGGLGRGKQVPIEN